MTDKKCNKCNEVLDIEKFSKDKNRKDGRYPTCKKCMRGIWHERKASYKESNKKYREVNKDKLAEYYSEYAASHKDEKAEYDKEYRIRNKDHRKEIDKQYRLKNADKISKYKTEWARKQRSENIEYRIKNNLRRRISHAIVDGIKSDTTMKLLGCSIEEFKTHLESKFRDGMSWDNYGTVWNVDHIRPCASFNLLIESEQYECFNHMNTQPLFVDENLKKGDTYNEDNINSTE